MKRGQAPSLFHGTNPCARNVPTKPTTPIALPVAVVAAVYKTDRAAPHQKSGARPSRTSKRGALFAPCPSVSSPLPGDLRDRDPSPPQISPRTQGSVPPPGQLDLEKRGSPLPVEFPRRYSTRVRHPWFPTYVIFVLSLFRALLRFWSGSANCLFDGLIRFGCCYFKLLLPMFLMVILMILFFIDFYL